MNKAQIKTSTFVSKSPLSSKESVESSTKSALFRKLRSSSNSILLWRQRATHL